MKAFVLYAGFLSIFLFILFPRKAVAANLSWYYTNWQYRREIVVNNVTGKEKTDYPTKIMLTDLDLLKQLNADCSDIRFTTKNQKQLSFWIRMCDISGGKVVAHIKLPLLARGKTTIYLYYGNKNAESKSNGNDTFDYFQNYNIFSPTVKFGVITDVHNDMNSRRYWLGPDNDYTFLKNNTDNIGKFVDTMSAEKADFVIELGDPFTSEDWSGSSGNPIYSIFPINGSVKAESTYSAKKSLQAFESRYSQFNGPRYYAFSDHEFFTLKMEDINSLIGGQGADKSVPGVKNNYYSFSQGGITFVILDLSYDQSGRHYGSTGRTELLMNMPPKELDWLSGVLNNSAGSVILFSPERIDDTDYLSGTQCEAIASTHYCTDPSSIQSLIDQCKAFGTKRAVYNKRQIRTVLEQYKEKVLAVFQGHDHTLFRSVHNGIQYISLNDAAQYNPEQTNYLTVEVDPVQKLMAIRGNPLSPLHYSITYQSGKMILKNNWPNTFVPGLTLFKSNSINDLMVEADWEITPNEPAQQVGVGFLKDADFMNIRHRCAQNGRTRKFNLAGIRRVFSNKRIHNYIGYQVTQDGVSHNSLSDISNATKGHFWTLYSDDTIRFWYHTQDGAVGGQLPPVSANLSDFSPGVWVFDNTTAYIDNLIVRKTVYPEPKTIIGDQETRKRICPAGAPPFSDGNANCDNKIDIFDFTLWLSAMRGADISPYSVDFNNDNKIDLFDFVIWHAGFLNSQE